MTIQEEIRRDVYILSLKYFGGFFNTLNGKGDKSQEGIPDTLADELLNYLHSKGVVIQVERELPGNPYYMFPDEGEWLGFQVALGKMVGYKATEPLIQPAPSL